MDMKTDKTLAYKAIILQLKNKLIKKKTQAYKSSRRDKPT